MLAHNHVDTMLWGSYLHVPFPRARTFQKVHAVRAVLRLCS